MIAMAEAEGALSPRSPERGTSDVEDTSPRAAREALGRENLAGSLAFQGAKPPSQAKANLLEVTAPVRRKLLVHLRDMLKGRMLSDPAMWTWLRSAAGTAIDQMWGDFAHEVERGLHATLVQQQAESDAAGPSGRFSCWWRFRAFVLHHYLPHNRSFFGKLQDPVYIAIYLATLIPIHGVRVTIFAVILLMLMFPGPPDEFQMINFILLFKGMQFLTSGLIAMGLASFKYFRCFSWYKEDPLSCIDASGPGASAMGLAVDYLGSITLVWIAFSLLPASRSLTQRHTALDQDGAGGRLRHLLFYDMKCFAVSLLALFLLTAATCDDVRLESGVVQQFSQLIGQRQFRENVFWCTVIYSLLSLPFTAFAIPGLQTILTHSDPTGYNRQGACVVWRLAHASANQVPRAPEQAYDPFDWYAKVATKVFTVMERGREARGVEEVASWEFRDLSRGLWLKLFRRSQEARARPASAESPSSAPADGKVASFMRQVTSLGREARGGDSPYRFGDFSRGLYWTVKAGRRDSDCPSYPAASVHQVPLGVSSVRFVPEDEEEIDGHVFFCIEVIAEGSLDAEGGAEPWRVGRRYGQFRELALQLG
ncbi:unnamed protein product, partial [Polarella glacialis]